MKIKSNQTFRNISFFLIYPKYITQWLFFLKHGNIEQIQKKYGWSKMKTFFFLFNEIFFLKKKLKISFYCIWEKHIDLNLQNRLYIFIQVLVVVVVVVKRSPFYNNDFLKHQHHRWQICWWQTKSLNVCMSMMIIMGRNHFLFGKQCWNAR